MNSKISSAVEHLQKQNALKEKGKLRDKFIKKGLAKIHRSN